MLVSLACWYSLEPPAYWEHWDPPSAEFSMEGREVRVEAEVEGVPEWDEPENGEPVEYKAPVIKSLVVKSNVELTSADIEQLEKGLVSFQWSARIKQAVESNAKSASRVLRWLKVKSGDAILDTNAVARRGKVQVLDTDGRILASTIDFRLSVWDVRPSLDRGLFHAAVEHCVSLDEPPLALELLLDADAHYARFDYRLYVLISALAIDAGLYGLMVQALRSDGAIETLKRSDVLGKTKVELEKKLAKGDLTGARTLVFKWLQRATLGSLVQAARALDLERNLQEGILVEIEELKKERDKLVHPRSLSPASEGDARRSRALARSFLKLAGQLQS